MRKIPSYRIFKIAFHGALLLVGAILLVAITIVEYSTLFDDAKDFPGRVGLLFEWIASNDPSWVTFLGTWLLCISIVWFLYDIFSANEPAPDSMNQLTVGRKELASRAELLARRVGAIHGAWQAASTSNFLNEMTNDTLGQNTQFGLRVPSMIESTNKHTQQYQKEFSEQCYGELWAIVGLAKKVVALEKSDIWRFENGVRTENDLIQVLNFLGKLSAALKSDEPDIPIHDETRTS